MHRGLVVHTKGRGTQDLTERVQEAVAASGVREGLCNVFVHHTSASLILCENADPQVRRDLEAFAARLVPDGERWGLLAIQKSMARMAPTFARWTPQRTLLANGRTDLEPETLAMLTKYDVAFEARKLTGLRVEGTTIQAALFEDGELPLDALLVHPPQRQSDLVLFAGLTLDAEGFVKIDELRQTSMAGVYAAGDLTGNSARSLEAANDGARAAIDLLES